MKFSRNGEITLPFTGVGKSCTSREFLTAHMSFNVIREDKILANIFEFTVHFEKRQ